MIDLHAHVLPGFDDGVRSLEEARQLARAAAAEGVTTIAATPHVRDDFPTTAERMERGVASLNHDFEREGIAVRVVRGGELDLLRLWQLSLDEVRRFTYGGEGRWALLETPYAGWSPMLERSAAMLRAEGIETLVAHPERNDAVQDEPALLEPLVAAGARVQVTAGSLAGTLGARARETAERLIADGLAHVLATDTHGGDAFGRGGGLAGAVAALGNEELARQLTVEEPTRILGLTAS